ncbi:MAG: chaperone NapD [Pseudomonadota bacterium]
MNLSGILVMTRPENLSAVAAELNALPGVEVHHEDAVGRLVAVLEAESVRAEADGLRRIKTIPGVLMAEMVFHYFEDDDEVLSELPPEIAALPGLDANACQ